MRDEGKGGGLGAKVKLRRKEGFVEDDIWCEDLVRVVEISDR